MYLTSETNSANIFVIYSRDNYKSGHRVSSPRDQMKTKPQTPCDTIKSRPSCRREIQQKLKISVLPFGKKSRANFRSVEILGQKKFLWFD